MESNPNHNSTDDSYDYLIAFLVVIGALAFIISESFPSAPTKKNIPIAATPIKSKKPTFSTKKKKTTATYYEKKQAERRLEEEGLRKWTDQLEQQQVRNTPYRIPKEAAPVAAAVLPAVAAEKNTLTTATKITPSQKKVVVEEPLTGTTVVKEKPLFIDTDIKSKETAPASNNLTSTAITKKEAVKPNPTKDNPPAPTRAEKVPNYENQSPKIVVDEAPPKAYNNLTAKSPAPNKAADGPSCIIMIAALKDKANINRLIKSLKKEDYEVYNKISGKYRAVGVRTSCDPAINKPVLREIKKKYAESAFLMKR